MRRRQFAWSLFVRFVMGRRAGSIVRTVARYSMASVAIGLSALLIVISVMNGFNDTIHKKLLNVEPHIVAHATGVKTAKQVEESELYRWLSQESQVKIVPYENQDVIIRTNDGLVSGAVARGLEEQRLKKLIVDAFTAIEPSRLSQLEDDLLKGSNLVIMGGDLAKGLGILEGDTITLVSPEALLLPPGEAPQFEKVVVKKRIYTNISDIDGKLIYYVRGRGLQRLSGSSTLVAGIEIRVPDPYSADEWADKIRAKGGTASTWFELNSSLFHALRLEKLSIGLFLTLSALIASFSLATVMAMLLAQKRKEIGLLMAMGLSLNDVRRIFLYIGMYLGGGAVFVGAAFGLVVALALERFKFPILPDIYYDQTIPAKFELRFFLSVVLGSLAIATLGSLVPVWQATKGLCSSLALRAQAGRRA